MSTARGPAVQSVAGPRICCWVTIRGARAGSPPPPPRVRRGGRKEGAAAVPHERAPSPRNGAPRAQRLRPLADDGAQARAVAVPAGRRRRWRRAEWATPIFGQPRAGNGDRDRLEPAADNRNMQEVQGAGDRGAEVPGGRDRPPAPFTRRGSWRERTGGSALPRRASGGARRPSWWRCRHSRTRPKAGHWSAVGRHVILRPVGAEAPSRARRALDGRDQRSDLQRVASTGSKILSRRRRWS